MLIMKRATIEGIALRNQEYPRTYGEKENDKYFINGTPSNRDKRKKTKGIPQNKKTFRN